MNVAETVAFDFCEMTKFVLKKMRIRKFDNIHFLLNEYSDIEVVINKDGKDIKLDFDAYIHHNDIRETEFRMEIDSLRGEIPNWQNVLDILENQDWGKYQA